MKLSPLDLLSYLLTGGGEGSGGAGEKEDKSRLHGDFRLENRMRSRGLEMLPNDASERTRGA